jgi:cytochrome P450
MGAEQIAYSSIAAIGDRPWLANALFRFTKWGNPFTQERFTYPYAMYDRMRANGPIVFGRAYQQWFIFGYDELQELLRSPDTATSPVRELLLSTRQYRKLSPGARENFTKWLLANDAPDHTRLRSAVSRAFTPKQIALYEPLVEHVVADLLSKLPSSSTEFDIVSLFTDRLPIQVIAEVLGLPVERRDWLHSASREIGLMLEALTRFDPLSMNQRFAELDEYFTELVQQRRRNPTDDLVSRLASNDAEPALDVDEIVAMIAFLLFAGHETVSGMLGNALVALERFPEQRKLLRENPTLIDNAVEELLRFDPPAQVSGRQATATITIGGKSIKKGQNVGLMIAAANRDKRRWSDADELRLDRPDPKPISFGFGAHHCLGAALARMELRLALPPLLNALGDYTIDHAKITWKRSLTLRGPVSIPLTAMQK